MVMPRNLILVRHGESEGNVANRASRKGDNSYFDDPRFVNRHSSKWRLSDKGIEEARWAGEMIRSFGLTIGRKYSSPYFRAMETMGYMKLGGPDTMIVYELRERSWGELDRLPHEERERQFGKHLDRRHEDPLLWEPPGGEPIVRKILDVRDWQSTLHRECGDMDCVVAALHAETMEALRVSIERMLPEDYAIMRVMKDQDIWNGSILHYTRYDPFNVLTPPRSYFNWVRLITPPGAHAEGAIGFDWKTISRPTFSDASLIEYVERRAPTLAST